MQHTYYYTDEKNQKDGPHDLVAIMRRIRVRKIGPGTPIYIDESTDPVPAASVEDIALLFQRDGKGDRPAGGAANIKPLHTLLADGWHFIIEHNVITVFAGALLLLSILLALSLVGALGLERGGVAAWCCFIFFHNIFMLFALRLHRGQTAGSDFVNRQLAPRLTTLAIASLVLALMMAGGFALLILPCIVVAVFYIFVPFLIIDRHYGLIEAMVASRLLLQKHDHRYTWQVVTLVFLHLVCLVLVVPIPLTLPVFSAALSELYEEISSS